MHWAIVRFAVGPKHYSIWGVPTWYRQRPKLGVAVGREFTTVRQMRAVSRQSTSEAGRYQSRELAFSDICRKQYLSTASNRSTAHQEQCDGCPCIVVHRGRQNSMVQAARPTMPTHTSHARSPVPSGTTRPASGRLRQRSAQRDNAGDLHYRRRQCDHHRRRRYDRAHRLALPTPNPICAAATTKNNTAKPEDRPSCSAPRGQARCSGEHERGRGDGGRTR